MKRFHLTRRAMLKGVGLGAGAMLLGPLSRQLAAHAEGLAPPKRALFMLQGNGMSESHVVPLSARKALGEAIHGDPERPSKAEWSHYRIDEPLVVPELTFDTRTLEPLEPLRDQMAIVTGLSHLVAGKGHSSDYGVLSCTRGSQWVPGDITLDQRLALELGTHRPFPVVALGRLGRERVTYATTATGPGKRVAVQADPTGARNYLFGSALQGQGKEAFDMQSDVLHFLSDDVKTFSSNLGTEEKIKLDHYLHSIEVLADRQTKLKTMSETLSPHVPPVTDIYTSPHPRFQFEALAELGVAALVTGLTDVVTLLSGTSSQYFGGHFTGFGDDFIGSHELGHGRGWNGQSAGYWLGEIHRLHTAVLASIALKLQAIPEGDGTMLDHTLLLYTNDNGNSHHNKNECWPTILISGANVPLKTDGRCVVYPAMGRRGHRQFSNLCNTILHAFGAPEDEFGTDSTRVATGPLPELLA